jgi:hypothetical protein
MKDRASLSADNDVVATLTQYWPSAGGCASMHLDAFFDVTASAVEERRAVCEQCPVVALCLARMLHTSGAVKESRFGIWGGVNADRVSGGITNYIVAIARTAASGAAGNEAAYLATRFLVEKVPDSARSDSSLIGIDDLRELVSRLAAAGRRRLAEAVRDVLDHPHNDFAEPHSREFVSLVRRTLNTAVSDAGRRCSPTASAGFSGGRPVGVRRSG